MKVLLLNGSPHPAGCTYTALSEVAGALNEAGVDTEILQAGRDNVGGCLGCGGCRKTGRCVRGGLVNDILDRADEFDALVIGAAVHYASPNGAFLALLDRLFFAGGSRAFANKPGAAVVSARRAGTTASLEVLQKYINYSNMLLVGSQYWPMVHGNSAEEVRRDEEGMQIMRQLGRNMAWLLHCIEAGRAAGIPDPEHEPRIGTNFIR